MRLAPDQQQQLHVLRHRFVSKYKRRLFLNASKGEAADAVVAFYWTVRKFWREFDGCSGCDKNRQKTVERFQAEEWFHVEVSGDCAAAAGSCGCKVILLLRQHSSASERRMNKSEYASVIMVLLRRINEFTATQKNTHGHEQLGLLALRAGGHVQTPPTFPDSIEPLISVFENTVGGLQFGYGCRGGGRSRLSRQMP